MKTDCSKKVELLVNRNGTQAPFSGLVGSARKPAGGASEEGAPSGGALELSTNEPLSRVPLYAQLADELGNQILQGVFTAGQKLPSVRSLSKSRQLSVNTVQQAYRLLEDRQWVVVRSQSGCYVAPSLPVLPTSEPKSSSGVSMRYIAETGPASLLAYRDDLIPFGAAIPAPSFFPCERLAAGITSVLRKNPSVIGHYNFAPGSLALRQQVARRVADWGARVDPRRVVITNGAVEAFTLCLRAVTSPGDTVAVESPAFYGFLQTLRTLGLQALPIPCTATGMDIQALDAAARRKKISAVLMSTTVSNPAGSTLTLAAKQQLVEVAVRHQIPVIEDATFADLHFEGECQAVQGLDHSGLIMLCASLTKTIAPGLRVGWVDGGRFSEQISYLKRVASIGQPQVIELALAEYLSGGGMAKSLRRTRRSMKSQVYGVAEFVKRAFPSGTNFTLPSGGFLLWLELPPQVDALVLQEQAVGLGVGVAPGALFSPNAQWRNFIRLNCGAEDSPRALEGLRALGRLTAKLALQTSP